MRKSLLRLGVAIMSVAALLAPATATAHPLEGDVQVSPGFSYTVKSNYCDGDTVHYKVTFTADGSTNANNAYADNWAEYYKGSRWHLEYTGWNFHNYQFTAGNTYSVTQKHAYTGAYSNTYYYRIVTRVDFYHGSTLLMHQIVHSVKC